MKNRQHRSPESQRSHGGASGWSRLVLQVQGECVCENNETGVGPGSASLVRVGPRRGGGLIPVWKKDMPRTKCAMLCLCGRSNFFDEGQGETRPRPPGFHVGRNVELKHADKTQQPVERKCKFSTYSCMLTLKGTCEEMLLQRLRQIETDRSTESVRQSPAGKLRRWGLAGDQSSASHVTQHGEIQGWGGEVWPADRAEIAYFTQFAPTSNPGAKSRDFAAGHAAARQMDHGH